MATFYDTIYRPPTEARSLLLEVSAGCSYGKCTFCRLSNGEVPLQLASRGMLIDSLMELATRGEAGKRLYLTGENVLAFRTRYLLDLFELVKSFLPGIREFAMYGRADDIAGKSDQQLSWLHEAGLDTVYVGVESGNARVLETCNKGETPEEIIRQLHRLDRAGIRYGLSSILGLGGEELWREHARDTAALYLQVSPRSIRVMTLTPLEGTPLAADVAAGRFRLPPPRMILEEERALLEALDGVSPCRFVGNHGSNALPLVGNLPGDRQRLIGILTAALEGGPVPEAAPGGPARW